MMQPSLVSAVLPVVALKNIVHYNFIGPPSLASAALPVGMLMSIVRYFLTLECQDQAACHTRPDNCSQLDKEGTACCAASTRVCR